VGVVLWSSFLCPFVCLSAHISQKVHVQISPNLLYILPAAVVRSSSDGSAICYLLPVLWMTSCFYIMDGMGQNQRRRVCFVQFDGVLFVFCQRLRFQVYTCTIHITGCAHMLRTTIFFQQGGQNSILYNLQNRHYLHCTRFPKDVTDEPLNYWFRAYPFIRGLAENGLLNIATVYSYPHYFLLLADRNTKKCYLYVC